MAANDLSQSLEDYLEAVFHIEGEKGAARAKDIGKRLSVSGPSVTGALRVLSEKGLVNYAPYDLITLTDAGRKAARDVVERHGALRDFFTKVLCLEHAEADEAACKMEHTISPKVLSRLTRFVRFVESCPLGGGKWIREFASFCREGELGTHCEDCLNKSLDELLRRKQEEG
ncbi:MAG: metal-dependent transcriptional regulator [Deltaproteobacteria bacterium]|nr:metal-dependent transcriptional regulator [Deltaproteobacteria bacterium]